MKTSELASRVGVLPSTISYYRRMGLLPSSGTTQGGFNLFGEDDVARATEIRRLQQVERLSLAEIGERLNGRRQKAKR